MRWLPANKSSYSPWGPFCKGVGSSLLNVYPASNLSSSCYARINNGIYQAISIDLPRPAKLISSWSALTWTGCRACARRPRRFLPEIYHSLLGPRSFVTSANLNPHEIAMLTLSTRYYRSIFRETVAAQQCNRYNVSRPNMFIPMFTTASLKSLIF